MFGVVTPVNATVFFFDGFESAWTGDDYAAGWIGAPYRHGDPPGAKMEQTTTAYDGSYGLQLIADSVPLSSMWWAAVEVENLPHYAMKEKHNPYVSVWYYDELWEEAPSLNKAGQVYAVPDWVNPYIPPGEDWTDVQFGAVEYMLDNYYYVAVGENHPGWQNTSEPRISGWHNLEFQLSSADGYIHFYLDGTEVGKSYRNDYTNLGTAIGLYTRFDRPLSDWGVDKPFTIWDDFEVGSDARKQNTFYFGDVDLSQWQSESFAQLWDIMECDLTLSFTIDLSGQAAGGWTPVEVGLRDVGYPNLDPNDHGGWLLANWQHPDTDPNLADLDDHFLLVDHGWASDEMHYDVDENGDIVTPFGSYDSYAFWFDRDGVDPDQATYWNYKDGITYNTGGVYDVVITYEYDDAAGRATMMATINGESQGFYLDPTYSSTDPPSEQPVGKSFTADDLSQMLVFLGRGGGGGSVIVSELTVTGCPLLEEGMATGGGWFIVEDTGGLGNVTPGGKASFGFVAKLKNDVSTGQVVFQYKTDDITLKSSSYDWVKLSTVQVMFEGVGTLNGEDGIKFRVRAVDGEELGTGVDRFEIRIWTPLDDYLSPTHRAEGNLMGGQIVVHKK